MVTLLDLTVRNSWEACTASRSRGSWPKSLRTQRTDAATSPPRPSVAAQDCASPSHGLKDVHPAPLRSVLQAPSKAWTGFLLGAQAVMLCAEHVGRRCGVGQVSCVECSSERPRMHADTARSNATHMPTAELCAFEPSYCSLKLNN
ncbi:hypothetical protein K466DRAFT_241964 [Polyporus arcularius HHB13444]|uniref:Uncharacterized protein n=1 Tax=Polyporus arcularius HHB13444 TaxID=1314778 RepID=A0A5C3P409_9APHY|nr:hypothetical protein K466DRAFT_241964 [Polyporus arcularius HHB13444]